MGKSLMIIGQSKITWYWSQMGDLAQPWERLWARLKDWHHQVWFLLAVCLGVKHAVPLGPEEKASLANFLSTKLWIWNPRCINGCVTSHLTPAAPEPPCPQPSDCHVKAHKSSDSCLPFDWLKVPPQVHLWLQHQHHPSLKLKHKPLRLNEWRIDASWMIANRLYAVQIFCFS